MTITAPLLSNDDDQLVEIGAGSLSDIMIDWLIARLEGLPVAFDGKHIRHNPTPGELTDIYSPSTNPLDGHPLLEREKIQARYIDCPGHTFHKLWLAQDCRFRVTSRSVGWPDYGHTYPELELGFLTGPTMLVAGLRFILAKHLVGKTKTPMLCVPIKLTLIASD